MTEILEIEETGFRKYNSIENGYQKKYIDIVALLNIKEWAISEKIHGSNSSICYNVETDEIQFAKRSGYLAENENFYFLEQIITNMPNVIDNIKKYSKSYGFKTIDIFGEVFGGSYLHPDVSPAKNASKVQKGVFYTPDNNFLAFDIRVDGEYVDVLKFQALCALLEVPYIPISTFTGNVYEAVEFCESIKETPSNIYQLYNLPMIEDNIREGVVLKPLVTARTGNGARVIIKVKGEKFSEKSREAKPIIQKELPEHMQEALNKLSVYATENRLNNVISHMGEVTIKDFGSVIGEFLQDIYADFEKDGNTLNTLEKDERKMLNKRFNSVVAPIVKKVLMELS